MGFTGSVLADDGRASTRATTRFVGTLAATDAAGKSAPIGVEIRTWQFGGGEKAAGIPASSFT
jgi:hypothetical protein